MWVEDSRVFGVELLDELVEGVEVFYAFAEHLLLDFVVDLVGFVFPVHSFLCLKIEFYVYKRFTVLQLQICMFHSDKLLILID